MYWLVEEDKQLEYLLNSGYKEAFIEVIPLNDQVHPNNNKISLVYLRPLNALKGFMVCVTHSETFSVDITLLNTLISKFDVLYCRDKKEMLHYFPSKALYDINTPPHPYIRPTTRVHDVMYNKHKENPNINLFIPVVKHYELCETIFENLKANINIKKTDYDKFFNSRVSVVFNAIERNGIRIHNDTFEGYFHPVSGEYVHTQFNLKTLTTRPSNKFKGVNYAALNKENGCRKSFIPRNDYFLELDISAYHPSLCCRLVDYKFPTADIHKHMAKMYKVDYQKSKELTFKQLYGGVFDKYKDLEFFSKISKYVEDMWKTFSSGGEIKCPISGYIYQKDTYKEMNPQKLFNYLLQNLETAMNVRILWDVLKILRNCKTKLILYTYDSFLFDVDEEEEEVIDKIKDVFQKYELNLKMKQGYDYDFR